MEKLIITEEDVKKVLDQLLTEEASKVSRQDFNRTQFKIEELENSLRETSKEFRKFQESIPNGLKNVSNKRITLISSYLIGAQGNITKLKDAVRSYKKKIYAQQEKPTVDDSQGKTSNPGIEYKKWNDEFTKALNVDPNAKKMTDKQVTKLLYPWR